VQRLFGPSGQGEAPHATPVCLLQPGLQAQLQACRGDRLLVVPAALEAGVLFVQNLQGELVVLLLPGQRPGLKRLAVGHREPGEKIGAECLGQEFCPASRRTGKFLQFRHIEPGVAGTVELHIGGGGEEEKGWLKIEERLPD